jgi:hypothetical protein
MAVRYYIQYVLREIEDPWVSGRAHGVTNHKALLDQIRRWIGSDELIGIVTFNYDTLIEHALKAVRVEFPDVPSFAAGDRYKLFKLHGSIGWCRRISDLPPPTPERPQQWQYVEAITARAEAVGLTDEYAIAAEYPIGYANGSPAIPAIAIPVIGKAAFECPPGHVEVLKQVLADTRKVIVVGWKAGERHFLQLLRERLPSGLPAQIVCGGLQHAQQTVDQMRGAGIDLDYRPTESSFSTFVTAREADEFLRDYGSGG